MIYFVKYFIVLKIDLKLKNDNNIKHTNNINDTTTMFTSLLNIHYVIIRKVFNDTLQIT